MTRRKKIFHTWKPDLRGKVPETWACVDCGINTAPEMLNRAELEQAYAQDWTDEGVQQTVTAQSEIYMVRPEVWRASNVEDMGGCLCIGCLEKRLGRTLTPKDFLLNHPFSRLPGTKRLLARRDGEWQPKGYAMAVTP